MAQPDEFRCFIGNMSWSTEDRDLKQAFEKFGHVVDAKVVLDKFSGRSRGFGFVSFEDEKSLEEAIEKMNGRDLDGRSITVDKARDGQDRDSGRDRDRGRGGERGSGGDCYKCGKPGHFARECPSGEGGGRGGGRYGGRDDKYGGREDRYGGREDRYGGREDRYGGGSRSGPERNGDRYEGRSGRDSRSGSDRRDRDRDRSGPYERASSGGRYRS